MKGDSRVRIIGGVWRSRLLPVAAVEGLRPSPDRLRETLFNWLQPVIVGARCLDLFAGSGVLGFEAASRGADHVTLVERDPAVAAGLERARESLGADRVRIVNSDAVGFLRSAPEPRDVVFVDPPWDQELHGPVLNRLLDGWLAPAALVHVESPAETEIDLPPEYHIHRDKRIGSIRALLLSLADTSESESTAVGS